MDLLIGSTGFVGSTLISQRNFDYCYNSDNIAKIEKDKDIDGIVVCAAPSAKKYLANQNPLLDLNNINKLISHIKFLKCKTFILISTVDVFREPINIFEDSSVIENGLHPYGLNRRMLENFVINNFNNYLIVRLSGLVGPGLRKNIVFDFKNNNDLDKIDCRNIYQFYPIINLWKDIEIALKANLKLIHLTAEPISVAEVSKQGFGKIFNNKLSAKLIKYDMRTKYGKLFGVNKDYQYSSDESINAIHQYNQSEIEYK